MSAVLVDTHKALTTAQHELAAANASKNPRRIHAARLALMRARADRAAVLRGGPR